MTTSIRLNLVIWHTPVDDEASGQQYDTHRDRSPLFSTRDPLCAASIHSAGTNVVSLHLRSAAEGCYISACRKRNILSFRDRKVHRGERQRSRYRKPQGPSVGISINFSRKSNVICTHCYTRWIELFYYLLLLLFIVYFFGYFPMIFVLLSLMTVEVVHLFFFAQRTSLLDTSFFFLMSA